VTNVANTSAKSTTKSSKTRAARSRQPSEQAAAQALIPSAAPSFKNDSAALKCSLLMLQAFCQEMMAPYHIKMVIENSRRRAKELGIEDAEETIKQLIPMIVQERYKNPLNAALDKIGFW
jgi:hypothetical protein